MTFRTNESASAVIDWDNPANNMYGCAPCPRCGGTKRVAYRRPYGPQVSGGWRIECDDCGHHEWAAPPPPSSETPKGATDK